MVACIAAIDDKLGIARDGVLPWPRRISTDIRWFRAHTLGQSILMGYTTFMTLRRPLSGRINYVATRHPLEQTDMVRAVTDPRSFVTGFTGDLWIIGGADVFSQTIDFADELYLTRVTGDYHCTQFFPSFEARFKRTYQSEPLLSNDVQFQFEIWRRNP